LFSIPKDKIENLDLDKLVVQRLNNELIEPDVCEIHVKELLLPMEKYFEDIW
jgi:hypothetical protein